MMDTTHGLDSYRDPAPDYYPAINDIVASTIDLLSNGTAWITANQNKTPTLLTLHLNSENIVDLMINQIKNKVKSFRNYEEGWDGYGGLVPNNSMIDDAVCLLDKLENITQLPRPAIAGDGEISFFWENEFFIDISFTSPNHFSYYAKDLEGNEFFGDDIPITEGVPKEILTIVQ